MTESRLQTLIKNKDVVFITVKNEDYIRVRQIERICSENAKSVLILTSEKGNPLSRAFDLNLRLTVMSQKEAGNLFENCEVLILGFLPQLIWKRAVKIAKRYNPDVIVISDFFLSMYDTVVLDRKYVGKRGIIAECLRKLDRRALEEANLVVTDTGADADFFAKEFDVDRTKFEVLYLEADESIYRSENGQIDKKSVLYFGTGLPLQGTDVVLEAFDKVSENTEVECIYIGSLKGVPKEIVRKARENVRISMFSWLSQEALSGKIQKADICLAGHFNPDIDKADRTIPGKAYIYETMGKRMILGDTSANHEMFKEDDRHRFVRRGDVKELSNCILEMMNG